MLESFIEGRVRLRSPLMFDAAFAERLSSGLLKIGGVRKAEVNPRTGGFLLEYDRARLPLSLLRRAAPLFSQMDALENLTADERLPALETLLKTL
ncbi:MAG: hypothetical protein LBO82_07185, partial [Synergistaceae bacterium]|nr:hypothetical protein [Synergistaceae bacterium]